MAVKSVSFAAPVADGMRLLRLLDSLATLDIPAIVQPNKTVEQRWLSFQLRMVWILCEFHSFYLFRQWNHKRFNQPHSNKLNFIDPEQSELNIELFFVHPNSLILSVICYHIYWVNIFIQWMRLTQHRFFACLNILRSQFKVHANDAKTMKWVQVAATFARLLLMLLMVLLSVASLTYRKWFYVLYLVLNFVYITANQVFAYGRSD